VDLFCVYVFAFHITHALFWSIFLFDQESNKQRGLPQLEAIESQLRRMHVDVKRIEEMLNAIGKKCQVLM
jgi:hypothetical protein